MSQKTNGVNHSMRLSVKGRRYRALERLDAQLQLGTKNTKEGVVPLIDTDKKRINKEMEILKKRC